MFDKILIANRGEIACRVIATARRLGIATVAVYSSADAESRHVQMADEAWPIGGAAARDSYLVIDRILQAAQASGAQAIHPGYGFLSENAAFAQACTDAGIVFIGPPAAAIRAMGSKAAAKALMAEAGVPLVPGYHAADQSPALLADQAARIGYPVLIKASAGGGGKGMRIVTEAGAFQAALEGAQREAAAAFGDDRVLLEKYLTRPRHIEIQVFADTHGHTLHLFERDCSIQRRHQKVLEEAPAPGLDPARRRAMGNAAVAAARAVGYVGAGTVEFIVEGPAFYFMEMNTRLQVEHPVTEAITGQDLVEWQLRVAAGERLPLMQDELRITGHAIEARIYAEDPAHDFLPSIGTLVHLRQPRERIDVRVDTGVRQGDAITAYYDPMIAKLIVHGATRDAAVQRLLAALAEYEVVGVRTNLDLLRGIAAHPAFRAAKLDTGFIARHPEVLATSAADQRAALAAASLTLLGALRPVAPADPWAMADAWRMNGDGYQDLLFADGDQTLPVRAHLRADGSARLDLPDGTVDAALAEEVLRLGGVQRRVRVIRSGELLTVLIAGRGHALRHVDPLAPPLSDTAGSDKLTAPIPAQVTRVLVAPGDRVTKGAALLVLEAMKTEITLTAPRDGVIESVRATEGEMVQEGTQLISFVPPS
jgi:3-methylcrotonyl-CoA carboxylase alpha subunit